MNNGISDHACAIISIAPSQRPKKAFKFCDMWIKHPDFFDMVQQAWQTRITGVPMFILVKKLQAVKALLKGLHRSNFSDLSKRIADVKQQIDQCQEAIQLDKRNSLLHAQERELKEQYLRLLSAEASLAKQQAKVEWLQLGDRNTTFYHAHIKQRRARNQIVSICNDSGDRVTDCQGIQQVFLDFYQGLLGSSSDQLKPLDPSIM